MIRSHYSGHLRKDQVGQNVTLAGWVARRRDHGGVAFIDLRDISGTVQVVINDEKIAGELRAEWCVLIKGKVGSRPTGNENPGIPTGDIEVVCESLEVLSEAAPLLRRRVEGPLPSSICFHENRPDAFSNSSSYWLLKRSRSRSESCSRW